MADPLYEPLSGPMYVTVGWTSQPPIGFTWRIWSSRTSFYLKSKAPGMGHLKLSVHGEDPRHPRGGGFKIAMDTENGFQKALADQKLVAVRVGAWPIWFPGKELPSGSVLVARLRWTWDACKRLPPAPSPGELKTGATGFAAPPPPEPGDAIDVDLILTEGKPRWLNEVNARVNNACLGPLRNDADQWLTGTVIKRIASQASPPKRGVAPMPNSRSDEIRGVSTSIDPDGFLWLLEQRMSRAALSIPTDAELLS